MKTKSLLAIVAVSAASLSLAACGDADTASDTSTTTAAENPAKDITVSKVWARNSPTMATSGAAYAEIVGGSEDDSLVGASVDASVAKTVEIHETMMADGQMSDTSMGDTGGMSTTTAAPAMEMKPVASLAIPAGKTVTFEPGGYHFMLIDLAKPLELGSTFKMTLTFEQAGEMTVDVTVQDAP